MGSGIAGGGDAPFRVFFIPFFVPSHMNPMTELACQFAARGVDSTMVVTPANGDLIRRAIERSTRAGHPIRVFHYPFPSAEVGLPEGVESLVTVSAADEGKIYLAVDAVQDAHARILREHRPDAVVADVPYWWTTDVARELGIPRLTFIPVGAFPLVVMSSLSRHRPYAGLADGDNRPFLVPDLPDPVEMVKSELPNFLRVRDAQAENADRIRKAQLECFGVVVTTFYEVEPAYCDKFRREEGRDAFFVGPCSLWSRKDGEEAAAAAENGRECMEWLDKQATASVVFVGFGSFSHFSKEQHWEMARGLEASGRPFLWALNAGGADEGWLPDGFEERVRSRWSGLVVKGWVPQVAILNHPSTGAFVTHLGWNSIMEGLAAGLPIITWPLRYEQFVNERMVVGKLRVGVRMWEGYRSSLPEEAAQVVVSAEAISGVVSRFAPPGEAGEEVEAVRKRAREYGAMARAAVVEGGSAMKEIDRLIAGLKAFHLDDDRKK